MSSVFFNRQEAVTYWKDFFKFRK